MHWITTDEGQATMGGVDTPTVRRSSSAFRRFSFSNLRINFKRFLLFQREFNIITGLSGHKEEYIQLVGNSRLLEKFFKNKECIYLKNGGSKRGREVVNDEDDFKKSKKQKSKTKMKKAIRNLQDRVAVVEGQLTSIKSDIDELKGMMSTILKHIELQRKSDEGDRKGFEGLVDHTVESEEMDNAKTEDVDISGTPNWLRMPKKDEISNGVKHIELRKKGDEDVHTVGTPPWLRFNIELENPIDVLEKKVDIGLEEPIDVVDDEVEIVVFVGHNQVMMLNSFWVKRTFFPKTEKQIPSALPSSAVPWSVYP
ncbi:Ulp1-like peptidase [Cucumis melo var. makuwa]|uniref:Ulp1-like peptidase n=1 Tax=Cucumis melo var. makuwa TaxID=1194695 RepID=A0A5D3BL46_CUCMM|nr:Ulp1-like peptidase [Cucumis melo var. makuwa]